MACTYLIREVEFPEGFVINNDESYILTIGETPIENQGPNVPVVVVNKPIQNERQKVRINVEKLDAETGKRITAEGGEYRLYGAEDIRAADGAMLVYKDGQIGDPLVLTNGYGSFTNPNHDSSDYSEYYLDLPLGHYYVEETKAPKGYALPDEQHRRIYIDASYNEDGRREINTTVTFEDDMLYVAFDALDFNDETKRLVGTKYRITGDDIGSIDVEIGPDGLNTVYQGTFTPGHFYTITEVQAAEGYGKTVFKKERDTFTTPYANNSDGLSDGQRWYKPVVTGAVLSAENNVATFTVENVKGVQVITLFNKLNPLVTFDALDYENTTKHLFGTEIEISGGDLTETIPITISEEGVNRVLSLTAGETYTITERKPVYGYGTNIYRKDGFHSPYEYNLNGYSDGTRIISPVSSTDLIQNAANKTKFRVEQRDGIQVVTLFNTIVLGKITGHKEGEVATGYEMYGDNAVVQYAYQPIEGVEYELYADDDIYTYDGDLLYTKNDYIATTTTDVDGIFSFENLPLGKYYVIESSTLYGLTRSRDRYPVNLLQIYEGQAGANTYNNNVDTEIPVIRDKRVRVDIGVPNENGITFLPGGDPMHNLKGKTGVKKVGISHEDLGLTDANQNQVALEGVEFTVYTAEEVHNLKGDIIFIVAYL